MAGRADKVQESISWILRLVVSLILPVWGVALIVIGLKYGSGWWVTNCGAIDAAGPAPKRRPCSAIESASRQFQALALGREDTASCHRARFFCSDDTRNLISLAKSTATSAVMSAMV